MYDAAEAPNLHARRMRVRHRTTPAAEAASSPHAAPSPEAARGAQSDSGDGDTTAEVRFEDNRSPVDPLRPDATRFPRVAHAASLNCSLEAGEALFMPAFTWHAVYSHAERAPSAEEQHGDERGERSGAFHVGINAWLGGDVRFARLQESLLELLHGPHCPEQQVTTHKESRDALHGEHDEL